MAAAEPVTDDQGFSNLYMQRRGVMLSMARRLIPEHDWCDAEDVLQEAWVIVLRGWVPCHQLYKAVRWAAKDYRSRRYGRTKRGGKPTRIFGYEPPFDTRFSAEEGRWWNRILSTPEPPSPADLQARRMRAMKGERS